jgi:hypothetical protein
MQEEHHAGGALEELMLVMLATSCAVLCMHLVMG